MMRASLRSLVDNRLDPDAWPGFRPPNAPEDEREAYQLQFELHEGLTAAGLGARVGWKIGCTTPVMQKFMSIDHPCSGGIMEKCAHFDHVEIPQTRFNRVGVECEIAVTMGIDLPAQTEPYRREDVAEAVLSCRAAMELVDDRYDDFKTLSTETLIVDDFFQSACVLGPEIIDWQEIDLGTVIGRTFINGEEAGRGQGSDIMGHPLNALAWLANNLNSLGRELKAGEFVLLGSMVECQWLSPGGETGNIVEMDISGLGQISAKFT